MNWFLLRGLEHHGFEQEANALRRSIINLVNEAGFYEYFDPLDGRGHGSYFFSWTAALFLDVIMDKR